MEIKTRIVRRYDHRLRDLVRSTGDTEYATRHGVPRSTARGWLTSARAAVVSAEVVDMDTSALQKEVLRLQKRVAILRAFLRLLVVLLRVSGFSLNKTRLPEGDRKQMLLRAIDRSCSVLPLRSVLRVLRLSRTRYFTWKHEGECGLDDVSSCPRTSPQQLMAVEIDAIKEMVTSDEYRHVPTGTLALLAQRLGRVFASPTTWYRLVRAYKWRRPRRRIHPAKPKVGIRASRPNEIWHVDMTVIRLLDGTRAYLHGVIDNFSRRILAWKVSPTFDPDCTAELLLIASADLVDQTPTVLTDGGVENFNSAVDKLITSGILSRLLAMTDIVFSNSMIESWFRSIKHQWLFLNTLDTVTAVARLVSFYIAEHNGAIPHSAFKGQTPDEMYFGTGDKVTEELQAAKVAARAERMKVNRVRSCRRCDPLLN